jgi:FkbM family methyltransferase
MLISVKLLDKFWNVRPRNVLHVGAHEAEEKSQYDAHGWGPALWIEAQPDKAVSLKNKFAGSKDRVIEAAVWDKTGVELTLKVTSMSQSTSLLSLGIHKEKYPDISVDRVIPVTTVTLDEITQNESFDFIALDIQGAELRALQGFRNGLSTINWIYTEVNSELLYEGCCLVEDLDEYLKSFGFKRVATRWTSNSWGDALYISSNIPAMQTTTQKIGWHFLNSQYRIANLILGKLRKLKRLLIKKKILRIGPKS